MNAKNLVLILALAVTAVTAGYAMQRPAADDALPVAEGVAVPQVVIVAKRANVAE